MAEAKSHLVVIESDQEGAFLRLPDGWLIEPVGAEVVIIPNPEDGSYLVRPLIGEDGIPNCKFVFPAVEGS